MNLTQLPIHIRKLIQSPKWKEFFDKGRLQRGNELYQDGSVEFIRVEKIEDTYYFDFIVKGSDDYETSTVLNDVLDYELLCDCSDYVDCKHAAATLFYLENHPSIKNAHHANPSQNPNTTTKESVENWMENLGNSLTKSNDSKNTNDLDYFKPSYKDRILYILVERVYSSEHLLIAKKAKLLKDGDYALQDSDIKSNISQYSKPKYISDLDFEILEEMSKYGVYGSYTVGNRTAIFKSMLEKCAKTNRLCVQDAAYQQNYTPFTFASPRVLTPNWQTNEDGLLKPSISVNPPIAKYIESTSKIFIDFNRKEIGILEQSHPDAFIKNWLSGPALNPDEIKKVEGLIKQIAILHPSSQPTQTDEPTTIIPTPPRQESLKNLTPEPLLTINRCDITPQGSLFLNSLLLDVVIGKISFYYDDHLIPSESANQPFYRECDNTIFTIRRNLKKEQELISQITSHKLATAQSIFPENVNTEHQCSYLFSTNKSANTIQWLSFLAAHEESLKKQGWQIETIGDLGYVIQEYDNYYEEINESRSDNDWFKFDLGIEIDGKKISLIPAIAAALSTGMYDGYDFPDDPNARIPIPLEEENHFVNFPAMRFKLILEKIQDLFRHINASGEIEIPRLRAATLVDDLDLARSNKTLTDLAELGANLKNIDGLPKVAIPKNLKAKLRDYQVTGFQWLQFLAKYRLHGVLADDMGLGKTLQALAHILAEKNSKTSNPEKLPNLVIAPTSVIPNWCTEAAKFTPSLSVLLLHGPERDAVFEQIPKHDIVITSYALLQRDAAIHTKQRYHIVILDESQYIKNAATITTKTAYKLNATHRICLSGTPMENHLGELWSTFNFLMPGLLQSHKSFNTTFRNPIEKQGDTTIQKSLNRRVGPLILRRTKDVVATELPPKTIIPHYITLNDEQIDLYETVRATMDKRVREAIKKQGLSKSHIIILDALLKLRQICCHPQLLKTATAQKITTSAKLTYLTELLETLIEEKRGILLFSQFTSMLSLIEDHLIKSNIPFVKITGSTKDRQTPVNRFQAGEVPVFLISLKAGGTGLNLTAADTVIHYDPWWNPAVENQATDRAYRIGQDKPVFVHKLICKGTIEEQIQLLQEKKAALVESLLSSSTNKLKLDQSTLSGLFAPIEL